MARAAPVAPVQGELQAQILAALWRSGEGTVEQVRGALPPRYRSAYTTVQTVLNRLAERGLLEREKRGNALVYRPRLTEAEYLKQSIEHALHGSSAEARRVALAQLIGELDGTELRDLTRLAGEIDRRRSGSR